MQSGARQRRATAGGDRADSPSPEPPTPQKLGKSPAGKTPSKKKDRIARPMNSFMIFAREFRAEMRERYPDIDNKDISKMLGQEWKTLSPDKKKTYYDKAAVVAEQHRKDHPEWKFVRAPPRKGKSKKDSPAPKSRKPKTEPSAPRDMDSMDDGAFSTPHEPEWQGNGLIAPLDQRHYESLRDLQITQSRLLLEQQQMEIAVLMAGTNREAPEMPPPRYVEPPPIKESPQDSVFLSAMELTMMARPPSAVTQPSVHPILTS